MRYIRGVLESNAQVISHNGLLICEASRRSKKLQKLSITKTKAVFQEVGTSGDYIEPFAQGYKHPKCRFPWMGSFFDILGFVSNKASSPNNSGKVE